MSKILEKALKDSIKENKCTFGTKEVINSNNSKLIVVSQSLTNEASKKITETAQKNKVPTVKFEGTSIALGKLCGLQFRISTIAFNSMTEATITSIIKESESVQ